MFVDISFKCESGLLQKMQKSSENSLLLNILLKFESHAQSVRFEERMIQNYHMNLCIQKSSKFTSQFCFSNFLISGYSHD